MICIKRFLHNLHAHLWLCLAHVMCYVCYHENGCSSFGLKCVLNIWNFGTVLTCAHN